MGGLSRAGAFTLASSSMRAPCIGRAAISLGSTLVLLVGYVSVFSVC